MIRYIFRIAGLNQQARSRFPVTETRGSDTATRQRVCRINASIRTDGKFFEHPNPLYTFFLLIAKPIDHL
jgi:hypothetical protein